MKKSKFVNKYLQVGLLARSPEGHAAKGMQIKGNEDLWIEIQAHTFRNWVNEHLRPLGLSVNDLATDLCDGTCLCALVEALQKRTLRKIHKPQNQHQMLENVTRALDAISSDGVKLVNIGNVDIVNGNLKLILGLIWSLIVRYQIGRSKFPPKKLMLAWLRSVLPENEINNLTTDWRSGKNLSALVDYCRPGLIPNWRALNEHDGEKNCRVAMEVAKKELGVPIVLDPEYLASPHLDELSGMTYLSYFMKENGPGFRTTLNWVRNQIPHRHVSNFTTDWNNGEILCELVRSLGGPVPGMDNMSLEQDQWESNISMGMKGGEKLGVTSILRPKDMADPAVDHLGVMAYVSQYQWLPARPPPGQRVTVTWETNIFRKGDPISFRVECLEEEIHHREIVVEVKGPSGHLDARINLAPDGGHGKGTFTATDIGIHEIVVKYQGEPVVGSPLKCRVVPRLSEISYSTGLAPCAVGSIVEVLVNPQDPSGAKLEYMEVVALSPSGNSRPCTVNKVVDGFAATFKPEEPGEWKVTVLYKEKDIQGSPFPCFVYDPNGVILDTLDGALPGLPFAFICDSRGTGGLGDVDIDVTHEGRSIPYNTEYIADGVKRILLPVLHAGKHRVHIYFNGREIRGSPFSLRVGSSRSRRHKEGTPPVHGKTRSFDTDYSFARAGSHSPFAANYSGAKHVSSGSQSFDAATSRSTKETTTKSALQDTTDAVHHRLKYGGGLPTSSNKDLLSSKLVSTRISDENLSSASAMKSFSESTRHHHNQSMMNSSAKSSTLHEQFEKSSSAHQQYHGSPSFGNYNGNGYHGDLVVEGDGLGVVLINSSVVVTITSEFGQTSLDNIRVDVVGPSGRIPTHLVDSVSSVSAKYTPLEVGEHLINVAVGPRQIDGSPFRAAVFNPKAIKVTRVPNGFVGRPVEIDIDGRGAGPGHLAILVDGGRVTSQVKALGDHRFRAVFVPHETGPHAVDMTFNGNSVPGSPWRVDVYEKKGDALIDEGTMEARHTESGDLMLIRGDSVKHVRFGKNAVFEINAPGFSREAVDVSVLSPSRKPLSYRLLEEGSGQFVLEFIPSDVGSHYVDINVAGRRLSAVAKVYNSSEIKVLDVSPGVVGQTVQFKVDAKDAGEGQLEISINDGELPNQVRVLGGGCCLVSFTPEQAKPHAIDIKFNQETIPGCPIICQVADTRQVAVSLSGLELSPVHQISRFHIAVDGSSSAELAVAVKGPSGDLPVKVSGSVRSGFTAEFTPIEVGPHSITVHHNGVPAPGTPFTSKAYDAKRVYVSPVPRGALGRSIQFTVDASQAGEGNLEITIGARGRNVPTQVHPQGGARFNVSFVPLEPVDHTVTVTFNKEPVPGSPFMATVSADPGQVVVSGPSLAATPIGKTAHFALNNVHGSLDDVEVSVEGPGALIVPTQVLERGKNLFGVEFNPKTPGEHRITVSIKGVPASGSPFACKVYDVGSIRVKDTEKGIVGKPVTFLVETSKAGPGNLEVTVNGGQVPTSAQAQGSHTYAISFTPKDAKPHMIELRFNNEDVPGSPFRCEVIDASKVVLKGDGLEKVPVGKRATFTIEPEGKPGFPEVKVTGPAKNVVHSSIQTPSDNKFLGEYVPLEVGDHTVDVSIGGVVVPGSPFLVKAYDASKVRVTDITPGIRGKPVYFSIDASGGGAGNLEIIVSVGGRNVPNYVQAEGNAKFKVNFRPQEAAPHFISVRFNGESVPSSPFACRVTDTEKATVTGPALKSAAVNQPASLTVDPQGADVTNCNVMVLTPSLLHLPINITGALPNKVQAGFTPTEVGPHSITVSLDGEPISGSPFNCNVYDVSKVHVSGLKAGGIGQPITFTVDASTAGEGTLELVVTTGKQSLRAEVSARSRGLYDVTFIPQEATTHFVNITFNENDVPGSPFECAIEESYSTVNGGSGLELESISDSSLLQHGIISTGLDPVIAGTMAYVDLEKRGSGTPKVSVIGPDGASTLKIKTRVLPSGYVRAEFTPDRVGTYEINVLEGSKALMLPNPLRARVFDPLLVRIRDKKETAVLGLDYSFTVETARSGLDLEAGDFLEIQVKAGLGNVPCTKRDLGNGMFAVNFKPVLPLLHRVHVLVHGYNAKGCPFDILVSDEIHAKDTVATGSGLYLARASRSAGFTIMTKGSSGRDFDVVVSGIGGVAVPVRCYQQRDGNLRAEFTPGSPGNHEVAVYHRSKMVKGSPFICHVYDPQKVLMGSIPTSMTVGQCITLPIDVSQAGEALLESDVTGPEGLPKPLFPVMDERHGENVLKFVPRRPGKYKVMLHYGGEPVPGCPIVIQAEEAGAAKSEGTGLHSAHVGKTAMFQIFGPGLPGVPSVTVEGPDSVARCDVKRVSTSDKEAGHFQASYVPSEVGVFDVRVTWTGIDIPGSPFHPRVVDNSKLRIIGGWDAHCSADEMGKVIQLIVGEERKIAFNTADSGPGTLEAKVELTSDPAVNLEDFCRVETNAGSRSKMILTPRKAGDYKLSLKWGPFDVDGAPKKISVQSIPAGEYDGPVVLSGAGVVSARCGEEAYFTIDASQAGLGPAQVSLSSSDVDVPVTVQPLGGGIYKGIYVPRIPGNYELNVLWGGKPVPGCPMTVQIGAIGDSSKVICTGDGLRVGTVGKDIRSFIDTRRAGPGELTAQCTGPRKTAYCELYDHGDGTFTLNIRPQEHGKHQLAIKYSGDHVPGSPFNLKVVGLPDASKVKVYGPGIEHGVLATFQSRFICDTRGAGAGQLTVRVRGPKGAFRVEMQRESQKDRTILCKFDPTEPGDYRVEVRWAGEDVPGSPFSVMIFDTQEELHHFLNYQGVSPGPGAASEFYGSTGYSMGQMSWRGSQAQL
ncbi:filamin-A isoform X3 [Folsomia candida]|uniref:filamin-A isoform X3 n=1 Tax=Folsomia candida TaxID=158441 RepID=UPI0016052C54|nr:filamin-A isoform X3 [Folsomia candida]